MTWALTILSIVGVVLNIYKRKESFIIWIFTNFSWMIIDFMYGIYPQSALFGVYFVLAVYGLIKWRKDENKQRAGADVP